MYGVTFLLCLVSRYILVEVLSLGLRIKQWQQANKLMREQGIPQVKEIKKD
jgi:hypothetical protein